MILRSLLTFTLLFSVCAFAQGRKPAVEDFVGVESETYKKTPKGTEVLFNFGNKIESVAQGEAQIASSSWFSIIGLGAFASLPFLLWFSIVGFKGTTQQQKAQYATEELDVNSSPVTSLDDYRKSSESDDVKKAS